MAGEGTEPQQELGPRDYPSFGEMWASRDAETADTSAATAELTESFPEFETAEAVDVKSVIEEATGIYRAAEEEADRLRKMPDLVRRQFNGDVVNMLSRVDTTVSIMDTIVPRTDGISWREFITGEQPPSSPTN